MSTLRTTRRLLRALLTAAAVVWLALAGGCGQRPGSRAVERDAAGHIVIDFWNGFTGPDGVTMTKMVNQFQKENPDIDVRMQIIPWGTYYDKLTLSMAYGGTPDVFILQAARFPEFASFHTLRPLTDLYASDRRPLRASDFAPVPWHESFYGGAQYALPLDTHPLGLYYNTKLFQEAGIVDARGRAKPPTNLAEFLADAKKLTKETAGRGRPDQYGLVFTNEHSNWLTFAHQFGGDIVTPDGKEGAMESPACLQATHLMCDLIYRYRIAPKPEGVDPWLLFRQGRAAMAMEGIYMLHSLQEEPGLKFSGAPAPQFGPRQGVWGGSHLLCQPVGLAPERARAAWRLMRFLSDDSLQWGIGGQVPARLSVERSPQFQTSRETAVQAQFARELPSVIYDPQIPQANALNQFVDPAIDDCLNQLDTPEHAMRDADRRIDQLLSRP
ncbi:MAG: ABC transporter substrate-binding protein [Armatimonadetes bacterium]|nr:ABC transporter substrate-binding protein [Armatimonadota bacterium]